MPAPEMTEELERDLKIVRYRNYLDPKHHYKGNDDRNWKPAFFQVATVVEHSADYYAARLTKKERKVRSLLPYTHAFSSVADILY